MTGRKLFRLQLEMESLGRGRGRRLWVCRYCSFFLATTYAAGAMKISRSKRPTGGSAQRSEPGKETDPSFSDGRGPADRRNEPPENRSTKLESETPRQFALAPVWVCQGVGVGVGVGTRVGSPSNTPCRVIDILLVGLNEAAAAVNGCRKRNYSWHPKPRDMGRSRNCRTLVMCRLLARNCPILSLSYGHFEVSLQRCTSVVASMALDCIGTGCAVVGEIRV